jgi:hypothetical protein
VTKKIGRAFPDLQRANEQSIGRNTNERVDGGEGFHGCVVKKDIGVAQWCGRWALGTKLC